MNKTLKAVIVEVSDGNVRNHHINLHGAFGLFPDDCFGGRNKSTAANSISLSIGTEKIETDIDETKAIFRERGAIRRFFERECILKGDFVLIERLEDRSYCISKSSKRALKFHL